MGYTPERFSNYDRYMISTFGGGRTRRSWAERIGKKYQWIALARFIGLLADHVPAERDDFEDAIDTPLVGTNLRDIDVSLDGIPVPEDNDEQKAHDLMMGNPDSGESWVSDDSEVRRIEDTFWTFEHAGHKNWFPLDTDLSIIDRNQRAGDRGFRRQIWVQIRSYLVIATKFECLWNWLKTKNFVGRWMPEGWDIGLRAFIGEYPDGLSFGKAGFRERRPVNIGDIECSVIPTTHVVGPEFLTDCSSAKRLSVHVPIPQLLRSLSWDGRGGYVDTNGCPVFSNPSVDGADFRGCFVQSDYLHSYLASMGMSLVWTVLSEKLPGDYQTIPRLEYSHIRGLHNGKIVIADAPILART